MAYQKLQEQEPIFVAPISLEGIGEFYAAKTTDEILDLSENNYIKDYVSVSGVQTECHVYMRAFSISDIASYTKAQAKKISSDFLTSVKSAICTKYLRCIARSFSVSVSVTEDTALGSYKSMTVRIMIAVGESNEERAEVISSLIAPTVELWSGYDSAEKISALNAFLLDGRFSYDMTLYNRSSVAAFVKDKKGVCEEYVALTSLFLDYMGIDNFIITGKVSDVSHMWNMVSINGRIYHLDILWNGPIDKDGIHTEITDKYLLKSTASVASTHTPDAYYTETCSYAIYDYYYGAVPEKIESEVYVTEGNYLTQIPLKTSVGQLKSETELDSLLLVKNGDILLSDEDYIGSGCTVELNANGTVIQSLMAWVEGDINGDGTSDGNDLEYLKDFIIFKIENGERSELLNAIYDINEDGTVSVSDLIRFYDTYLPEESSDSLPSEDTSEDTQESGFNTDTAIS